jgi:hypothetical protein
MSARMDLVLVVIGLLLKDGQLAKAKTCVRMIAKRVTAVELTSLLSECALVPSGLSSSASPAYFTRDSTVTFRCSPMEKLMAVKIK